LHLDPSGRDIVLKVTFVVPPNYSALDDRLEPHLGLLYMAAVLLENNYEVEYCDLEGVPEERWAVPESDVYAITVYGVTLNNARKLAALCKRQNPQGLVVIGGPQVSGYADQTLRLDPNFDCGVVFEGDFSLLEAIRDWGKKRIYQVAIPDLDVLPMPARHLVDFGTYTRTVYGKPSISLITQRGCPFSCYFCANDRLFDRLRQRSVEKVVEEIRHLIATYDCRNFYFHDNIISIKPARFHQLLEQITPLQIEWFAYDDCRGEYSVEEYLRWYEAGCRVIFLGVESGSDRLLKLMNKKQTKEKIRITIRNMEAAGIEARCALLFGYPGETRETWEETRHLVEELQPAQVFVNYFVPFVGTDVFERPQDFGIIEMDKEFDNHALINKDGYGIGTFSTNVLSKEEYTVLAIEVSEWWKEYICTHPAKGAPSWTKKILEMMSERPDFRSMDSTALELIDSMKVPIIARS
jgi:radical SAM superfamily enzyme YgiQ (UPF0313 family)